MPKPGEKKPQIEMSGRLDRKLTGGIIGIVFALIGLLVLFLGWQSFSSTNAFLKTATRADGIVVELEEKVERDDDGGSTTYYFPIVEFKIRDGSTIRWVSKVGSSSASVKVGERVDMLYNPKSPHDARIDSFENLWMISLILGVAGIVSTLVGFLVFGAAMNFDATELFSNVAGPVMGLLQSPKKKEKGNIDTTLPPPS